MSAPQGSVITTTDAVGNATQTLSYDEYGNLTSGAVITGEQYRYTGRRFDPETNLYYYRARYYTPDLGRFLQVDPIGYKDDFNLYAYVGNDPGNKTDPSGNCAQICAFAVGGAIIGGGIEAYNQYNSGSFDPLKILRASGEGALMGVMIGAGGLGAPLLGYSATTGRVAGAFAGGTLIPAIIGVASGETKASDVSFGGAVKNGIKEAAIEISTGGLAAGGARLDSKIGQWSKQFEVDPRNPGKSGFFKENIENAGAFSLGVSTSDGDKKSSGGGTNGSSAGQHNSFDFPYVDPDHFGYRELFRRPELL